MAKYIIDLDSLIDCLDFLSEGKIDDIDYTYLEDVKDFISRFPKYKVEETVNIEMKNDIKISKQN